VPTGIALLSSPFALEGAVTASALDLTATRPMDNTKAPGSAIYRYCCSVDSWIKQANPTATVTVGAKVAFTDGDLLAITLGPTTVTYEFDVANDGVAPGNVLVDIHAATTAASVAAKLVAAIIANQSGLNVTDNHDGTILLSPVNKTLAWSFTVTVAASEVAVTQTPVATAGAQSYFCPAKKVVYLDGSYGTHLSVLRDSSSGKASLNPIGVF
jgi:hypothetical protein